MIPERKCRGALRSILILGLIAALNALWGLPADAQVAGAALFGTVADQRGGAIPGATVRIRNGGTGVAREVITNAEGFYSAPNLLPGAYDVTASAKGFQTLLRKGITLTVGAEQALNLTLKVGEVHQVVEVSGAAPAVETASSTISGTENSTTMRQLVLNGRDWTSLATLEPGAFSAPNQVSTAFSANKGNRGFGNQLAISGHRPNQNTYRLDGIVINDYSNSAPGGTTGLNLGVDAIQEFSVLTSNYSAEYGRTSGGVINAITKSGANEWHGTAFFFDRDKIFDAKNFFDPAGPIPPFRRIQFGGSGGRAVLKNKLFVFGSYEGLRQSKPVSQLIHVPTNAERAMAVPAVAPYLKLWPEAPAGTPVDSNGITQSFNVAIPVTAKQNFVTTRVDYKISQKDSFAASYFFDGGPQSQPDPLLNAVHQVFSRQQMVSVQETHILSSTFVNTVRAGFSRVLADINAPASGDAVATDTSLAVAPGAIGPPQLSVPGVLTTAIGLGGLNRFKHRWNSFQAYDDAFVTRGRHSIKFGFAAERMQYNVQEQLSPNGRFNSYPSLAALLNNAPNRLNALVPGRSQEVAIRETLIGAYVQDDWSFRPNLTLNMGLRYEFTTRPNDANGAIQEITTLTNCATPGIPASPASPCGPVHVDSFISQNPTLGDIEPRVGFAWDPFRSGKTAVRGGFGIFDVLPLPYEFGLNTAATFPFQVIGFANGAALGTGINQNLTFNPNKVRNRFVEQDPRRSYVLNWNLNVQREVAPGWTATLAYVGSRAVHLSLAADDVNLVPPVATPFGVLIPRDAYQIDPNFGGGNGGVTPGPPGGAGIRPVLFDGESTYHALQAKLRKAFSHGFQGQASYTFSKCRDTSSDPVTGDTFVNSIAVPLLFSKQARLGACDFDIHHVFVGNFIWNLPGPKSGVASYLAGGWEFTSIITATSGSPFTPTIGGGGDPLNTGFNGDFSMDFASLVPGCNPISGDPSHYLNLNCFTLPSSPTSFAAANCAPNDPVAQTGFYNAPPGLAPPPGMTFCQNLVGNAGRNSLYGPHLTTVDVGVFKNFKLYERFKAQFRAEFFNILNHPNLAAPNFLNDSNNSIFDSSGAQLANAGVISSTATSSRQIQLGLKLVW